MFYTPIDTLYIYGDSYADPINDFISLSWTTRAARLLECSNICNRAKSGSGQGYSINKFISDIDNIKTNDAVIFVLSSAHRLNLEPMLKDENADFAVNYLHIKKDDPSHWWLNENYNHIMWHAFNTSSKLSEIQANSYLHLLKSYAESKKVKMYVVTIDTSTKQYVPVESSEYFLFQDSFTLNELNFGEYVEKPEVNNFLEPRINHLTEPNLDKLASIVATAIRESAITAHTVYEFKRAVLPKELKTKEQYKKLIHDGLLTYMHEINKFLYD